MDGVLIDSEIYWQQEEFNMIKKLVPNWQRKDQAKIVGLSVETMYHLLHDEYGLPMTWEEFLKAIDKVALMIFKERTNLLTGAKELLKDVKGKVPIGLSTSARRSWIEVVFEKFNLAPYFDVTVSFEEIEGEGKPAPDIYLHTAKILGVNAKECVVIEDSTNGVMSAKAAGMFCVGLRNGFNDEADLSGADVEAKGLKELDWKKLKSFLQ